ncbi:hypothetical protein DSM100238_0126 [Bifidobacterium apri]|uniref:Uncharacterized protein n=1 Tax=Bifidobacterium apri TaxID=1769423 RepID=A0A6A2W330_9BIFI|nr:hypothetical protein DSM100238_0126 [Bifidobacterium apri]
MFIVPQPEPQKDTRHINGSPTAPTPQDASGAVAGIPALPRVIPRGARIVVRTTAGTDSRTGRMTYRDYVGHVEHWDGSTLTMIRDAAANGSRPQEQVSIEAESIVRLKPVPERPRAAARHGESDAHHA